MALDISNPSPAYQCGRLLSVLESIQRRSSDSNLNTTIIDRYYGIASSAPASIFGTLIRGSQPHLAKLRKNHRGAAKWLEEDLQNVLTQLPAFPSVLTAKDQALFALGYYHQRANNMASGRAAIAARIANEANDDEAES